MEAALAVGVKAIRTLFGRSWNPRQVRFRHVPAASYSRLYEYFRAPVVSSADTYSIRFSADDLRLRRATRDDTVGAIIKEFLDERMRRLASSFRDDVERLVARRLRDGEDATLTAIAAVLAMGHRTLQRRLHDAGTDFASVLADARATIVLSFLASAGDRPISKLTELLGYSAPSAVCRFVRFRFGCDARELRNRLLDGSGDYLAGAERAS